VNLFPEGHVYQKVPRGKGRGLFITVRRNVVNRQEGGDQSAWAKRSRFDAIFQGVQEFLDEKEE